MEFISKTLVDKGWSGDIKYCAKTSSGEKYLLRITPFEKSANREKMFLMQKEVEKLGVPMCRPIEFGTCDEGVYVIQTWIDGFDAEEHIPRLPLSDQYKYGLMAGKHLKKIHSIPAPSQQSEWEARFNKKIDRKIKMYEDSPLKYEGGEAFLEYINANRHLLKNRPQSYQHGDYHIGNMMIEEGELVIIDFDRFDFGDPWEEFNRIVWCAQVSGKFASGMVDGYFDGNVPYEFWQLLALYISSNTLSSLPWAIPFGAKEIEVMQKQGKDILSWYANMKNVIPNWYTGK
ncbi:MAG: phosphotransferase [Clostridia bacterium]|nr:phosphotransferase [Clostridia bacterium]